MPSSEAFIVCDVRTFLAKYLRGVLEGFIK